MLHSLVRFSGFHLYFGQFASPPPSPVQPAQLQNEDRIKISTRSVEFATTQTKNVTSESSLHRITPAITKKIGPAHPGKADSVFSSLT